MKIKGDIEERKWKFDSGRERWDLEDLTDRKGEREEVKVGRESG